MRRSEIQELQWEDTLPFAPDTTDEGRVEERMKEKTRVGVCGPCYQTDIRTGEVGNPRDLR